MLSVMICTGGSSDFKGVTNKLDPLRDEIEEEFEGDLLKPRKVHHRTKWKHSQDAVHWIHLAKEQEKCVTCWQTNRMPSLLKRQYRLIVSKE